MSPPEMFIETPSDISHGAARRCFDIIAAALALIIFAPIMVTVAVAIIMESGFPVMFRQARIGVKGRAFQIYKFRKFYQTCEGPALTTTDDIRYTKLGRFLGKAKLDELPQLWNVVMGDMAIVGPRPESFDFSTSYRDGFEEALQYKPGLVGPSQVFFRFEASQYPADQDPTHFYRERIFPIKAGVDIAYCRRRTLTSDFVWIWRSVVAVLGWIPWEPNLRAI